MVTSRPRSRLPSAPIAAPLPSVNASKPTTGLRPATMAPAAPANPMWESA